MNITVTTLGGSWAIIPELVGFVSPRTFDFYAFHPSIQEIEELRRGIKSAEPDEVWIITTEGMVTTEEKVESWFSCIREQTESDMLLRFIRVRGIDDLFSMRDCRLMRDAILNVVLAAKRKTSATGQLILSLTGGRKTMSSDMHYAASFFGCAALVHIVDHMEKLRGSAGENLRKIEPHDLQKPLPGEISETFMPLVIGSYPESPLYALLRSFQLPHMHIEGLKTEMGR